HNHQCYRLAARICTRRYGVIATLAGGVGNEIVEALGLLSFGHNPFSAAHRAETWGDLKANWRGVGDALRATPWQHMIIEPSARGAREVRRVWLGGLGGGGG